MRPLKKHEIQFIESLLQAHQIYNKLDLASLLVQPLLDGGMGSLQFQCNCSCPQLGRTIAEYRFQALDGVEVIATLSLDQQGHLFELDMWKTDFSLLQRWPQVEPHLTGEF